MTTIERPPFVGDVFATALLTGVLIFDKRRQVVGIRLTLHDVPAGKSASDLLSLLWQAFETISRRAVFVGLPGAQIDPALVKLELPDHVVVEVPADVAADLEMAPRLEALSVNGKRLAVAGLPPRPIPLMSLCRFEAALVPASLDRRLAPTKVVADRSLRFFVTGAATLDQVNGAFERGAAASVGWPVSEKTVFQTRALAPAQSVVLELLRLLRDDASLARIESVLKRDTAVAYKLLKMVNSPAAGLQTPVRSFQQAVMAMGHARLQRWLVLMLSGGNDEADARPLAVTSTLRGLLLDGLSPVIAEAHRDSLFATGAFSLLDRITGTSMQQLIEAVGLESTVGDAIGAGKGPLSPFLAVAQANDAGDAMALREALVRARISPSAYNTALLQSLADGLLVMNN